MKGIILAGGKGTRLDPLTRITNKHLVRVYDKPMIFYPIQTLLNVGITDILIVSGPGHAGQFMELLISSPEFNGTHFSYLVQKEAGGIAQALGFAEDFADHSKTIVILGDNIIEKNIKNAVDDFSTQPKGAKILLKEVEDPQRFGVAEVKNGRIIRIIEKPQDPPSKLAVTGIYMYDGEVYDIIRTLKPSARGELEITDVNNAYLARAELTYEILEGWWSDAGTHESLRRVDKLIAETGANHPG
ncbi:MAG: NTP transferase domain-containing protein [Parcubacteria group bacterium]|nr:NTP transferase domain-containing protein [Parcubacteria group bacterium]